MVSCRWCHAPPIKSSALAPDVLSRKRQQRIAPHRDPKPAEAPTHELFLPIAVSSHIATSTLPTYFLALEVAMKFSQNFHLFQVPEWESFYINYDLLKRLLNATAEKDLLKIPRNLTGLLTAQPPGAQILTVFRALCMSQLQY